MLAVGRSSTRRVAFYSRVINFLRNIINRSFGSRSGRTAHLIFRFCQVSLGDETLACRIAVWYRQTRLGTAYLPLLSLCYGCDIQQVRNLIPRVQLPLGKFYRFNNYEFLNKEGMVYFYTKPTFQVLQSAPWKAAPSSLVKDLRGSVNPVKSCL